MRRRVYDLATLQGKTGLSFHQVYYRLVRMGPLFTKLGHPTQRTQKNKIVLSAESVGVFLQLVELERTGLPLQKVLRLLDSELAEQRGAEVLRGELPPNAAAIVELSRRLQSQAQELASLRQEIRRLRKTLSRALRQRNVRRVRPQEPSSA